MLSKSKRQEHFSVRDENADEYEHLHNEEQTNVEDAHKEKMMLIL